MTLQHRAPIRGIAPQFDRRQVLAGVAGAAAAALSGRQGHANEDPPSLRLHAERRGMVFGCAVKNSLLAGDPAFRAAVIAQAGMIVPEFEMKWRPLEPDEGRPSYEEADAIADFSSGNGLALRGHTTVWHKNPPIWAIPKLEEPGGSAFILDHVRACIGHFRGRVAEWDVVNEAIEAKDGRRGLLRDWAPYTLGGYDFIADCFKAAHEADPGARLYYNDYDLEYATRDQGQRRDATLRLIEELMRRDAPIHGLGIQSHLVVGAPFIERTFRTFLSDVGALGLSIKLTELDVSDRRVAGNVAYRDRRVAEDVRRFLTVAFDEAAVDGLLTWGLTDRYSWLHEARPRHDGEPQRCLPLDADYRRKPVWTAIAECFDQTAVRA